MIFSEGERKNLVRPLNLTKKMEHGKIYLSNKEVLN